MDRPLPCFFCGYDLRGSPPAGKCPECGRSLIDAVPFLDTMARRRAGWVIALVCLDAVLFFALLAFLLFV